MKTPVSFHCKSCELTFEAPRRVKLRWAAAIGGLAVGALVTESIIGGVIIGGLTYGAVTAVERLYLARRCPECGAIGEPVESSEVQQSAQQHAAAA